MKRGIAALTKRTDAHVTEAIEKTLRSWSLGSGPSVEEDSVDEGIGRGPESAKAKDKGGVKVLVVKSVAHAEEFLRLSQRELQASLNREKQDFVTAIRRMAEEARGKRFQELKDEFTRLDPLVQAELREEIIEDLNNQSVDVRQVVFNHIKNEVCPEQYYLASVSRLIRSKQPRRDIQLRRHSEPSKNGWRSHYYLRKRMLCKLWTRPNKKLWKQ
jgi:hypothetical protein